MCNLLQWYSHPSAATVRIMLCENISSGSVQFISNGLGNPSFRSITLGFTVITLRYHLKCGGEMKGMISGLFIFTILPSDARLHTISLQLSNLTIRPLSGQITLTDDSTTDLMQSFTFCTVS